MPTANKARNFAMCKRSSEISRGDLEAAMKSQLNDLSVSAILRLIADLLETLGYHKVSLLDRRHLRGRRSQSGAEITAKTGTICTPIKLIAQVKKTRITVQRQAIDELAGVALRHQAHYGFLFVTSQFSPTAKKIAEASEVLPLRLIDGDELVRMLIRHRLGVKAKSVKTLVCDDAFFADLSRRSTAS